MVLDFQRTMIKYFLFISLLIHATTAAGNPSTTSSKWLTLNGQAPAVVARGGFSGLFPESSDYANQLAISTSVNDVIILCNLQLTKDSVGICQPDVRLDNTTTIANLFENQSKTYNVNGQSLSGWFAFDYTSQQLLSNVTLVQNIMSRPSLYDGQLPITTVDDIVRAKFPSIWINVQYDQVYSQHKLSMSSYILRMGTRAFNYISSPEIAFLKEMKAKLDKDKTTKVTLFFVFLDEDATEPTTNQTYGAILKNLATVKTFASGIVVPKEYIWPVNKDNYLEAPTTLVTDAQKAGLQVYVSGFANDVPLSYNYSYDPSSEYLQFVDNSQFSVDGFITDFPPTASQVVSGCFSQSSASKPKKGQPLIITHNGASGDYAGCTDLAYQQAIEDGADIIDCSVQMSQDGVAFCMNSADVTGDTNAMTTFISRSTTVPEIQKADGVFSFDLSWSEIQSLQPQLFSPFEVDDLARNPANNNKGKFLTLPEFLQLAQAKAVSGILINIENAAYLASKKGLDIVTAVSSSLTNATFDKQSTQQVLIQSDDTSVLSKFQNIPAYKRVLFIDNEISDAPRKPVEEITKYTDAVTLTRFSIIPTIAGFTEPSTKVVEEMHAANLSVYVSALRNEFTSLAYDYFADPTIEVATYVGGIKVDGVITEFPATTTRYLRSPCSDLNADLPFIILPAQPGGMLSSIPNESMPPASAPRPALDVASVVDPPLPDVAKDQTNQTNATAQAPGTKSGAMPNMVDAFVPIIACLLLSLLSIRF